MSPSTDVWVIFVPAATNTFMPLCPKALKVKSSVPGSKAWPFHMKAALHGSYTSLEEFIGEVFELDVSRSMLCDQIRAVSGTLTAAHQEVAEALANEPSLHVDETGRKDKGDRY